MNNELREIALDPRLPEGYAAELNEALDDTELERLEGIYCGVVVFRDTQADTNPTTGEIVGYSQTLTFSSDPFDPLLMLENGRGGALEYSLAQGVTPESESYIRRSEEPRSLGRKALDILNIRGYWQRKRQDQVQAEQLQSVLSSINDKLEYCRQHGRTVRLDLLAPDSCVYEDAATGSSTCQAARNIYFIGNVAVDQEDRASDTWRGIEAVADRKGLTKYLNYQKLGLGELLLDILKSAEDSFILDDQDRSRLAREVCDVIDVRQKIIDQMKQFQQDYVDEQAETEEQRKQSLLRRSYGVILPSDDEFLARQSEESSFDAEEIQKVDQWLVGRIYKLFSTVKEVYTQAEKRNLMSYFAEIFGTDADSPLQNLFWSELSRAVVESGIDERSQELRGPVTYIADLPNMINLDEATNEDIRALYQTFRDNYGTKRLALKPVKGFMKTVRREYSAQNRNLRS